MRIGFNIQLKDNFPSGVERYSIGLVNSMSQYCPENEYYIFTNSPEYFCEPSKIICNENAGRLNRIIWEHTALPKLSQKYDLDLLHCPHYICPLRKTTVPYVVTIHDTIAIDSSSWCTLTNAMYYRIMLRSAAKAAKMIAVVSKETKTKVVYNLNVSSDKVAVVYPGIDNCFFKDRCQEELDVVREKFNLPDNFLLYTGNIEPKKNIRHIIDAFRLYRSKDKNCGLVIVGKRSWKSHKVLSLLKNIKDVTLTGYVSDDELACIYRLAKVFLFPSKYEGFGFPPLEAMASGTPVICSANGALKETVNDVAVIIEHDKPISTYNALIDIDRDCELRDRLKVRGRILAERFNWQETIRQMLDIYRGVSGEK